MSDDVWPGLPTGPNEFETREQAESADVASLQRELAEQERIAANTGGVFDKNRVPAPGEGVGGRVRINRDHWGE
jgi:hypothetical protein